MVKYINCNIGVNQGFSLSPTLFGIYNDNLQGNLEEEGCVDTTLAVIVNILLVYVVDIVLIEICISDLDKQLKTMKDFFSNMDMTINTNKTKVMIIKSNKFSYDHFVYDKKKLDEVYSYKYLHIDICHKLNWNYSIEKRINGGWKAYFGLEK